LDRYLVRGLYAAILALFWLGILTLLAGRHVLELVPKFCLTMAIVYGTPTLLRISGSSECSQGEPK